MIAESSSHPVIALVSYHHKNTEKVAQVIAEVLGARILPPRDVNVDDITAASLIGFGSGIYGAQHHRDVFDLVDRLPEVAGARAFIFSTFGAPGIAATPSFITKNHSALRERLQSKGFTIVGEFACPGFNTNSFLRFFGGLNKGHPTSKDLERAAAFARGLRDGG